MTRCHDRFAKASDICRQLTDLPRCFSTLIFAGFLFLLALSNLDDSSFSKVIRMGIGAVTSDSVTDQAIQTQSMSREKAIFLTVLIANSPQPLLSFLFLTYNSLYTCMLMVQEWSDYARERKYLRVTEPTGRQRSTYRLQLPYKYGIPLVTLSGILHWLVSQSIFLVVVEPHRGDDISPTSNVFIALGFSCIAILATIILGSVAMLTGILIGFQ